MTGPTIESAAEAMGVWPGDAAWPFLQSLMIMKAELENIVARAENLAAGQLADHAIKELPDAVDRLILARQRRLVIGTILALGVVICISGLAGYWAGYHGWLVRAVTIACRGH